MEAVMNQGNEELLTVHELAAFLKVPISWCYSRSREKGPDSIPRLRCGRYVRFPKGAVLSWLKGRQEAAN